MLRTAITVHKCICTSLRLKIKCKDIQLRCLKDRSLNFKRLQFNRIERFYIQNRNPVRFAKFRGTRSKILQKICCPPYKDVSPDILSQLNLNGILPNKSPLEFHRDSLLLYSYIAESSHPSLFFSGFLFSYAVVSRLLELPLHSTQLNSIITKQAAAAFYPV